AGPEFGVGFYRAGAHQAHFTFDAERRGIDDSLRLPVRRGRLLDAACVFGAGRAWLFTACEERGSVVNGCVAFTRDGAILGTAEAPAGDGSWLGSLGGSAAAGELLFAPTDSGIVRVEAAGGKLTVTRAFPDTAPFVDAASILHAGGGGLWVA